MKFHYNIFGLQVNLEVRRPKPGLFILNLHNVVPQFDKRIHDSGVVIDASRLKTLIKQIRSKYEIRSIESLFSNSHQVDKHPVVIFTVDDGFDSDYFLLEIFQALNVPVCYFLNGSQFVTDRVILSKLYQQRYGENELLQKAAFTYRHTGIKNEYDRSKVVIDSIIGNYKEETVVLNYFDYVELAHKGITIGYHGKAHERFCFLEQIEDHVLFSPTDQNRLFAWPYGKLSDIDQRIFPALEKAKCRLTFSAYGENNQGNEAIFNRINVSNYSTISQLFS